MCPSNHGSLILLSSDSEDEFSDFSKYSGTKYQFSGGEFASDSEFYFSSGPIEEAIKNVEKETVEFNKRFEKTPFAAVGTAVQNGMKEVNAAVTAFKAGDQMGGSAAVLRSAGAFAGALALAGPAGAAAGALLAAITSLISTILEAMKPASESLEVKIESLLDKQELKNAYIALEGNKAAWAISEADIKQFSKEKQTFSWDYLTGKTNWKIHHTLILTTLEKLKESSTVNEWMKAHDSVITYALRFWILISTMGGVLKNEPNSTYATDRDLIAKQLLDTLRAINFNAIDLTNLHARWYSNANDGAPFYYRDVFHRLDTIGRASSGQGYSEIYQRIGVINGNKSLNRLGGDISSFAVSKSGTFIASTSGGLAYGRNASDLTEVSSCPGAEQVAIGELGNNLISVATLFHEEEDYSRIGGAWRFRKSHIALSCFNDATGVSGHDNPNAWTKGEWRWENWIQREVVDNMTVLALAIEVNSGGFTVLAFAIDRDGNGRPYSVRFEGNEAKLEPLGHQGLTANEIFKYTYGFEPIPGQGHLGPFTVTTNGNRYFHIGNCVLVQHENGWDTWDLQSEAFFSDSELNCYQFRAFRDGSVVAATNKGLVVRAPDMSEAYSKKQDPLGIWTAPEVQTMFFWRTESQQAVAKRELFSKLIAAAQNT